VPLQRNSTSGSKSDVKIRSQRPQFPITVSKFRRLDDVFHNFLQNFHSPCVCRTDRQTDFRTYYLFTAISQGRRHGFESGGGILRAERAANFFDPPLFGQWGGTKYCLSRCQTNDKISADIVGRQMSTISADILSNVGRYLSADRVGRQNMSHAADKLKLA